MRVKRELKLVQAVTLRDGSEPLMELLFSDPDGHKFKWITRSKGPRRSYQGWSIGTWYRGSANVIGVISHSYEGVFDATISTVDNAVMDAKRTGPRKLFLARSLQIIERDAPCAYSRRCKST